MWDTGVFLVFLLMLGTGSAQLNSFTNGIGSFIGGAEEASFTVQRVHKNFVEREYPAQKWVCTAENRSSAEVVNDRFMLFKLVRYVTGQNSHGRFMSLTMPVTTEYSRGGNGTNRYIMCLFIDKSQQADPPAPNDSSLFIQNRKPVIVYARTVRGYVTREAQWLEESAKLAGFLQQDGISVPFDRVYWVSYGLTFRFWNARSEVWFTREL